MENSLNFVLAVNLITWAGLALYLFSIDKRIKKLEKSNENSEDRK